MLQVRQDAEQLFVWELGEGLVNIWWDNWSLDGCLIQDQFVPAAPMFVKDIWAFGKWNLAPIIPFCSPSQLSSIQKLTIKPGVKDKIVVRKNPIPSQQPHLVHWGHTIWNNFLTPSMSFFIWRLFSKMIPTDDILKLKGLRGPSRCFFCLAQEETISHLFFECHWVQEVWSFVIGKLRIPTLHLTWKMFFTSWADWRGAELQDIPNIVAWFVWMARNQAKHDSSLIDPKRVGLNCIAFIQKLINFKKYKTVLEIVPVLKPQTSKVVTICWTPPKLGWIKINIDGSQKSQSAGIGGVFRNHEGKCILYFQSPIKAVDSLEAECQAVFWALNLARSCLFDQLWVESDSLQLINILHGISKTPWNLICWMSGIHQLLKVCSLKFSHIHREGNRPANWLARRGLFTEVPLVSRRIPPPLDFLLSSDRLPIPYLRKYV
ncbi:uncharacterized protein LOC110037469 [Phalaenopsis equestris]|uniref:uncharacterized protein LOC110037469 n=2 Tax=Phalaenopsis equestris TaxID=78828 RepID=UPI0009E5BCF1|nr:uncharacterized protein LOC110037469 [Phalaenopsis equestris]